MRRSPETLIALTWPKQRKLGVRNIVRGCIPAALSTRSPAPAVGRPAGGRRGWPGGAGFLKPSLRGPVPSHHRPHLRQLAGREYHRAVAARPRSGSARWPRAAARRARFHPPSMIAADGVASGNGGWPLAAHGLMYGTTGPGRHLSGGSCSEPAQRGTPSLVCHDLDHPPATNVTYSLSGADPSGSPVPPPARGRWRPSCGTCAERGS